MKLPVLFLLVLINSSVSAQYYYKDILGTKESADMISNYRNNKVHRVIVNSYDENNVRIANFVLQQEFSPVKQALTTITKTDQANQSVLTTFIDAAGRVIKSIDSSESVINQSVYHYNSTGQLTSISITSNQPGKNITESEEHIWQYTNGKVSRMLRIKNKIDTTFVDFKLDESGNVIEEQETKKGKKSIPVLYYYDDKNRLTDIVRFNNKARRLLPEYLFEYSPSNQVIQKITVPAAGSEYIIWRYQYDQKGLRIKEAIYNKQKQLTGKIEYQYSFGSYPSPG
ncbi:MAG TPA: hypothetical protein VM368_10040 [Flavisolibacter sp.]|nr:hypothetical protein [Flavisolibacter sp.]